MNVPVSKDRLKRKLRHLCRFLALVSIVWLIYKSHQDFLIELGDRGHPIELSHAQLYLPTVASLESDPDDPSFIQALDANGTELGLLSQTSPAGDSAIGFSGSTNLLVIWDLEDRVSSVSIRSSGDTIDHVDAILEDPAFFSQFEGKSMEGLAHGEEISAVSGATLTSLAIADALSLRFGGTAKASRFPEQIRVEEVTPHFPTCTELRPSSTHTSLFDALDENGSMLGQVGRTSPHADSIVGYQGPIDVLLVLENNGTLKAMQMRSSFENEPYADYPKDDYYLPSLFEGRSIPQLADMNETADKYEGVSGATMTSRAMAKGIVETARQWEAERKRAEAKKPWIVWGIGETGSLGVILLAGFVAFTKRGNTKFFRQDAPSPSGLLSRVSQRGHSLPGPLCRLGTERGSLGTGAHSCPAHPRRPACSHGHGEILLLSSTLSAWSSPAMDAETAQIAPSLACQARESAGIDSFHPYCLSYFSLPSPLQRFPSPTSSLLMDTSGKLPE